MAPSRERGNVGEAPLNTLHRRETPAPPRPPRRCKEVQGGAKWGKGKGGCARAKRGFSKGSSFIPPSGARPLAQKHLRRLPSPPAGVARRLAPRPRRQMRQALAGQQISFGAPQKCGCQLPIGCIYPFLSRRSTRCPLRHTRDGSHQVDADDWYGAPPSVPAAPGAGSLRVSPELRKARGDR